MNTHLRGSRRLLSQFDQSFKGNGSPAALEVEKFYRSCRRNRWGAAAVEFAVVAPVFFLMVFGMIEYGRMV
ncbi:MAG TPA: TadE/TadG family type IV pilus assembly protein, partial [Pirellulales bacterium]